MSKVGAEATVGRELDVRDDIGCLLQWKCDCGKLHDGCTLIG